MSSFISGPIAPENNPAIEPQNFEPSVFPIIAITRGDSTTVTTNSAFGVDNNYVVGQLVRFIIPPTFGIRQLNNQQGYVTSLPATNQVVVDINSSFYDPFIPSPSYGPTPPQICAIGDVNSGVYASNGRTITSTTIPGSFRNISPN